MPVISALARWGQEDHKFEARPDYVVSSVLALKKQKTQKEDFDF
jgi:hypothetical protein